jgi:hypothetical protein
MILMTSSDNDKDDGNWQYYHDFLKYFYDADSNYSYARLRLHLID